MTDFEMTVDMLNRAQLDYRYWPVDHSGIPVTALVTENQVIYYFSEKGTLLDLESQVLAA